MITQRASHWLFGTVLTAAAFYFASVATAETVADAFEPDFEGLDAFS
jgi:hypothetical protein